MKVAAYRAAATKVAAAALKPRATRDSYNLASTAATKQTGKGTNSTQSLLLSNTPSRRNGVSRPSRMRAMSGCLNSFQPSCCLSVERQPRRSYSQALGGDHCRAYHTVGGCRSMATKSPLLSRSSLLSPKDTMGLRNRKASTASTWDGTYEAVVVGGGPAGITVVGNLLEQRIEPIFWVDDAFNGGRVNRCYREVPSNTKVGLFVEFATAVSPFREIVSGNPPSWRKGEQSENSGVAISEKANKLQALRELDQSKGCQLSYAADMCLMLTEGLRRTPGIHSRRAKVREAVLDPSSSKWTVKIDDELQSGEVTQGLQAKRLVLCTGSSPNNDPLPVEIPSLHVLDLDCALSPTTLSKTLAPLGPTTIAVVGASHSAILVLMNLYNLASSTKPDLSIRWFTRHPLRYAEYMDGWILRDNTGLKGEAATWAKQNLEPETFSYSDVSKYVTKITYEKGAEKETFEDQMKGCNFYVQAIGYNRDPIPKLSTKEGRKIEPLYDHETGKFSYSIEGDNVSQVDSKLPSMYGAGIAWPEKVKDPLGNVEYAVGFFKFMKFVKRVVPSWH